MEKEFTLCKHGELRYKCLFCKDEIRETRIEKLLKKQYE